MFQSTKRIGPISTTHRNWKAACNLNRDSTWCSYIHGYSRYVEFTFEGELDEKQWVFDYGYFKEERKWIESQWDHKVLIASDDPELPLLRSLHDKRLIDINVMDVSKGWGPGIEGSCKFLFDNIQPSVWDKTQDRVNITKIQIWEHEFNSSMFIPLQADYEMLRGSRFSGQ